MMILLISIFSLAVSTNYLDANIKINPSLIMAFHENIQPQHVQITKLTLLAREEKTPPPGKPPIANRDIGFASVFIRIQNPQRKQSKVIIQSIQIVNDSDGQLQTFSHLPKEIVLQPLENSEQAFHLTNKTGYFGKDKVKAVVTYQINNQMNVIMSDSVAVNRR